MVAITVILAAVIGTFVLGLTDNVGGDAPSGSLSVQDADFSVPSNEDTTAGDNFFKISVQSISRSEAITSYELRFINASSAERAEFLGPNAITTVSAPEPLDITYNGNDAGNGSLSGDLNAGDTIFIRADGNVSANGFINSGTDYTVQLIYTGSDNGPQIVAEATVELN